MPREQINFPQPTERISGQSGEPDTIEIYTDPAVHVNWHNAGSDHGGHVQIALECDRSYFEQFLDEGRSCRYSPVLTRSDVNKLIRILRRARDQAYGRDE